MAEERLKILRTMNNITEEVSLKKFAEMVDLTMGQMLEYLKGLEKAGLIRKAEQRYSITREGKNVLKIINPVPKGSEFYFYTEIGNYTGLSAKSLKEFFELIKTVDVAALAFHFSRGDFENWIRKVFNDTHLANELRKIRKSALSAENLKNKLINLSEAILLKVNSFSERLVSE